MKKIFVCLVLCLVCAGCGGTVDYSKYDLSDINSISRATKAYQREFRDKKGTKEAAAGYLKFEDFYYDAVERQRELITNFDYNDIENYQKQAQEISKKYANKGLYVQFDEGSFFIVYNFEYLYKNFAPYLSEDWQELLKFKTYYNKRIISDGRYVIPKSEFVGLINFYKEFTRKYPKFVEIDSIKNVIKVYEEHLKTYPDAYL